MRKTAELKKPETITSIINNLRKITKGHERYCWNRYLWADKIVYDPQTEKEKTDAK